MRLLFSSVNGEVADLDLSDEMSLLDVQPLLEEDLKISANHMSFFHNGKLLDDKQKTLKQLDLKDNEMILVTPKAAATATNASGAAATRRNNQAAVGNSTDQMPQIDFSSVKVPGSAGPAAGPQIDFSSVKIPTGALNRAGASSSSAPRSGSRSHRTPQHQQQQQPGNVDAIPDAQIQTMIKQFKRSPNHLDDLRDRNAALADAIQAENLADVRRLMQAEQDRMRRLYSNPLDPEAQKLIEDEIRRQNVQGNLENALEHLPEVFASVTMLYVRCRVNGHEVLAFVDSGAQSTIMSEACATRCDISRLMDARFSGIAKGVGEQRILGRIHLAQMEIDGVFVPTSFTVLKDQPMEILIGLDMLRRHQCIIDLPRNVLVFGTVGMEAKFLPESELPAYAKIHLMGAESEEQQQKPNADGNNQLPATSSSTSFSFEPSEEQIVQLEQMGFEREKAKQKLRKFYGDVNAAASELLNERP